MSKLGPITKGAWFTSSFQVWAERDGKRFGTLIASLRRTDTTDTVAEADEKLIADAGNTANRTGKLPSELEAERDELLAGLVSIEEYWNRDQNETAMANALWYIIETARALIAKSTGK